MRKYKYNDQRSLIIRNMDNSKLHYFLCHGDNPKACDGGATCTNQKDRQKLYDMAFEENDETE